MGTPYFCCCWWWFLSWQKCRWIELSLFFCAHLFLSLYLVLAYLYLLFHFGKMFFEFAWAIRHDHYAISGWYFTLNIAKNVFIGDFCNVWVCGYSFHFDWIGRFSNCMIFEYHTICPMKCATSNCFGAFHWMILKGGMKFSRRTKKSNFSKILFNLQGRAGEKGKIERER